MMRHVRTKIAGRLPASTSLDYSVSFRKNDIFVGVWNEEAKMNTSEENVNNNNNNNNNYYYYY